MDVTRNEDGTFNATFTAREMGTLQRQFERLQGTGQTRQSIFNALNEAAPDLSQPEFNPQPKVQPADGPVF